MREVNSWQDITVGQYQDPMLNLHNTLALIYRPITKKDGDVYEIENHKSQGFERRAELFRDKVSIETVLGATLFFSLLGMELSTLSLESFIDQMSQEVKQMKMTTAPSRSKKRKQKRSKSDSVSMTPSPKSHKTT
jgi:hypothetical protein